MRIQNQNRSQNLKLLPQSRKYLKPRMKMWLLLHHEPRIVYQQQVYSVTLSESENVEYFALETSKTDNEQLESSDTHASARVTFDLVHWLVNHDHHPQQQHYHAQEREWDCQACTLLNPAALHQYSTCGHHRL